MRLINGKEAGVFFFNRWHLYSEVKIFHIFADICNRKMTGSLQFKNKYLVKILVICVFYHLTIRNISKRYGDKIWAGSL